MTDDQLVLRVRKEWRKELLDASITYSNDDIEISESLLAGMLITESNGNRKVRPRYESHVFNKIKKIEKAHPLDVLIASASHGPFQIMGYHSKDFSHFTGNYGSLPCTVDDFYKSPAACACMFLTYNCAPFLRPGKVDHEKTVRMYNGGSPNAKWKTTNAHVERFFRYKGLYIACLEKVKEEELDDAIVE